MRSLATREAGSEISQALPDVIAACKVAGFDLVIVETSGIGQGDAAIVPLVDVPLYVMTPEFGAASQLEKIDMLDFADFVAINKFDRKGALDALRDVAQAGPAQPRGASASSRTRCRCSARWPRASTTTASPRCTRRSLPQLAELGLKLATARCRAVDDAPHRRTRCRSCRRARALPGRDRRHRARLQARRAEAGAARARGAAAAGASAARCCDSTSTAPAQRTARRRGASLRRSPSPSATAPLDQRAQEAARRCGRRCSRPTPATSTW